LQQIKILYAEDYDLVLFTVKQLLELEGWSVDICRDGSEALKKIEGAEHYDVIVVDAELPGTSGINLLSRARELTHRRRTPMIMFTANDCEAEALAAGADAFLRKPGGIRDLIQTIERLLNKGTTSLRMTNHSH
jgi:CheY-like chemotaxis protein